MNDRRRDPRRKPVPAWHRVFLAMLPKIVSYAKGAFSGLDPEARQEAVQNVVTNSCAAVAALARRGKLNLCYATVLAQYGIKQTRDHRITGGHLAIKDVLSRYCQQRKGVVVERLDQFDKEEDAWQEAVVVDTRKAPVPEIVSFRVDFSDWLASLPRRNRRIAQALSLGHTTTDVARRFKLCAGRVSQLRRELADSWRKFVGDEPSGAAVAA